MWCAGNHALFISWHIKMCYYWCKIFRTPVIYCYHENTINTATRLLLTVVITTAKQYMLTFSKPIHKDFNVCLNVLFHDGSFSNEIASDQLKTRFRGSLTATNCARSPKTFYNFVRKHYIYSAGLPCHLH